LTQFNIFALGGCRDCVYYLSGHAIILISGKTTIQSQ